MRKRREGTLNDSTVVVAADELLSGEFDAETVILDLRNGVYYGLAEAGARIWQLLKRPTSLGALCRALVEEYNVEPRRCESDLKSLLRDLLDRGLIRVAHDHPVE